MATVNINDIIKKMNNQIQVFRIERLRCDRNKDVLMAYYYDGKVSGVDFCLQLLKELGSIKDE